MGSGAFVTQNYRLLGEGFALLGWGEYTSDTLRPMPEVQAMVSQPNA